MRKEVPLSEADDFDERPDTVRGCDKIHHFLRSVFYQPNHLKVRAKIIGNEERVSDSVLSEATEMVPQKRQK